MRKKLATPSGKPPKDVQAQTKYIGNPPSGATTYSGLIGNILIIPPQVYGDTMDMPSLK